MVIASIYERRPCPIVCEMDKEKRKKNDLFSNKGTKPIERHGNKRKTPEVTIVKIEE
jgi:hypothetical protein